MARETSLTLTEAKLVAEQIRTSTVVDKEYWPWVVDQLCTMVSKECEACAAIADDMEEAIKKFGYPGGAAGIGNRIRGHPRYEAPQRLHSITLTQLDVIAKTA